eukprot:GHVH01000437.1.p1 GENE.GHVH01000437.1~~GHVH01000437.1.p1  ORF type:complete len:428 (+),score=52.74 GHVH01000437.1:172-1284(+)
MVSDSETPGPTPYSDGAPISINDSDDSETTPDGEFVIEDIVNATLNIAGTDLVYYVLWREPKDPKKVALAGDLQTWEPASHVAECFGELSKKVKMLKDKVEKQMEECDIHYDRSGKRFRPQLKVNPAYNILAEPWDNNPIVEKKVFFIYELDVLENHVHKKILSGSTSIYPFVPPANRKGQPVKPASKRSKRATGKRVSTVKSSDKGPDKLRKLDDGTRGHTSDNAKAGPDVPFPPSQPEDPPCSSEAVAGDPPPRVREAINNAANNVANTGSVTTLEQIVPNTANVGMTWEKLRTGITNGEYFMSALKVLPDRDIEEATVRFSTTRTGEVVCTPKLRDVKENVTGNCCVCQFLSERISVPAKKKSKTEG